MNRFSLELASSILHLEMQKDLILKEETLNNRLCHCRGKIFENYVNICQLFFIRFTAKIIKFLEDENVSKTINICDLKTWYTYEMYDKLYSKNMYSNKMIMLFKLLQERNDKQFFNEFKTRFSALIKSYSVLPEEDFRSNFHQLYADVLDWMETHILSILSLKINCDHISNDIFEDYKNLLVNTKPKNKYSNKERCEDCEIYIPDCPSKEIMQEEYIHLYVTNELFENKWILEYFDILKKYHSNLKEVGLILDFVLYDEDDPFIYFDSMQEHIEYMTENFKFIQKTHLKEGLFPAENLS
jgi:hypothetical protein